MNQDQESFFGMTLKVKSFDIKYSVPLGTIPALAPYYAQHNTLINRLIIADNGSRADLRGYAIAKGMKREALEKSSAKISNGVAAYCAVNNDPKMKKSADVPASKWYTCSEEELITEASIMKNLATSLNITDLEPFGINAADVTGIGTCLKEFIEIVADPSIAIDQRKLDNTLVVKFIDEIRTNLTEKLDVVMRNFEIDNPNLYQLYRSARAIDINGSVHQATAQETIAPGISKTMYQSPVYDPQTFYTVKNLGTETVCFSLSTADGTNGVNQVLLNPGETRSRLAENLTTDGTFFVISNASMVPVEIKLWVE